MFFESLTTIDWLQWDCSCCCRSVWWWRWINYNLHCTPMHSVQPTLSLITIYVDQHERSSAGADQSSTIISVKLISSGSLVLLSVGGWGQLSWPQLTWLRGNRYSMGNNCSGTLVEKEKKLCRIVRCGNGESELLSLWREQFGWGVLKGTSGTQIKRCKCSGINLNPTLSINVVLSIDSQCKKWSKW